MNYLAKEFIRLLPVFGYPVLRLSSDVAGVLPAWWIYFKDEERFAPFYGDSLVS